MNDQKLFELIEQAHELDAKAKRYADRARKARQRVLAEFERRDIAAIEDDNFRCTWVQNETTHYDLETLSDALAHTLSPAKYKRVMAAITNRVLDKDALSAQVQTGVVPPEVVADASEVRTSAAYLRISVKD